MKTIARLAALTCALSTLSACDPAEVNRHSTDATRYFSEKVLGAEYDVSLVPAAAAGLGPLVVTRSRLTFEDGSQIPLAQVAPGIYRTPSLRSRYGARGSRICGGRPVSYLALHQAADGLYYLNAGDWLTAPARPAPETQSVPGACETAAYRLGTG